MIRAGLERKLKSNSVIAYTMNLKEKLFHWLPRLLGFFIVIFVSILSGVRFNGLSFSDKLWSVMTNLIPAIIVLMVLIFSYYRELSGGIIYILLGLFLIILFTKNTSPIQKPSIPGLISSILMVITGILFIFSFVYKKGK